MLMEGQMKVCELKLLFLNCARWTGSELFKSLCLIINKINVQLGRNNKTFVWSAACQAEPNMGSPLPTKSDIRQQLFK